MSKGRHPLLLEAELKFQAKPRVLAQATVDELRGGTESLWHVEVTGQPPHDHRRTYTIQAKSDNDAAKEGLARFIDEMENLDVGASAA